MNPDNPREPAATLIPYDVASPLWSDAAEKLRYFALPDGAPIQIKSCAAQPETCDPESPSYTTPDDGHWAFPDGTVLVKSFMLGGRLIETRLLVRVDEFNWWGYSYEWREDQSDAELLASNTDGYERPIDVGGQTQTWHYPSRSQCLQCHTEAAGRSLGPETVQLNAAHTYPNGITANQLDTLARIDLFGPGVEPAALPPLPDPADTTVSLEARARSYLHANCAICHRPGGEAVSLDLRFGIPFADTQLCGLEPEKGDLDVPGALLITPGDAARSVLSLRMHTLDTQYRMPRIGTRVVDEAGVAVVDAWINSLTDCP